MENESVININNTPNKNSINSSTEKYNYDIAFSFAGENRDYVEKVAQKVRESGLKVFYDEFERVNLWGKNLVDHFDEIYSKRSRYVVMFISRHYVEKAWTNHERKAAMATALKSREEFILPARFDNTILPGLPDTVAYIDLNNTTPIELAKLIVEKVGSDVSVSTSRARTTVGFLKTGISQTKHIKFPIDKEENKIETIEHVSNTLQVSPKQYPKGVYYTNIVLGWICIVLGCFMLILTFAIGWSSFIIGLFCVLVGYINIGKGRTGLNHK